MTQPFNLIGLTGPAGSGKDTVAAMLRTHAGFYPLAFADALREEVSAAWRIEPLFLIRRETKEHPMSDLAMRKCLNDGFVVRTMIAHSEIGRALDMDAPRSPRQIMQWWGTEYRRQQDSEYWTRMLERRVERLIAAGDQRRLVVTDCRFGNEVACLRAPHLAGVLWQITRPGCGVSFGSHVSEVSGADFQPDRVIENSGDMTNLKRQVLGKWWALDAGLADVTVEIAA
jgi:hypothetical protein